MDSNATKESYLFRLLTVVLFLVLTIFGIGFSAYLLITANNINMVFLALLFIALTGVAGFFNVYGAFLYYRSYFYSGYLAKLTKRLKPLSYLPSVAIAMPVFNEDTKMVERDITRLSKLNYPKDKLKFYILDDSTDPQVVGELSRFSARRHIVYMHRDDRAGFKARAFNSMLKACKEEFVAIFDADEYLTDRNFLNDLLPYFSDSNLAYVQTEKSAFKGNFFSDSVNLFDAFFFRFIQPARALNNTALFAGSCGIIRKSALDEVGGFPESVVEDTFFSFESDMHDYKSLYVPKVYAYGRPVTTFTALVRQQWRYNYGCTQFLSYFMKRRPSSRKLSGLSNTDYLSHGLGLNYLSIVLIMFTITSVFIAFSGLPLLHLSVNQVLQSTSITLTLELFGGIAFILALVTPALLTKMYFGSFSKGLMVFALNFALAVSRAKAAFAAMLGKDPSMHWHRVREKRRYDLLFALQNTKVELTLASGLLVLGSVAMLMVGATGGFWLLWYGVMYLMATIMLYRYG